MRRPRISTVLITLIALAAVARWIDVHPYTYRAHEPELHGTAKRFERTADVLVLVDPGSVYGAAGDSFENGDWSYGWMNLAEQEFGRFALTSTVYAGDLAGRRAVVVTRSALGGATVMLPELRDFVRDGGLLVLEQPDASWQEFAGAHCGEPVDQPGALTLPGADPETADDLSHVPLVAGSVRSLLLAPDATPHLRVGNAVVASTIERGDGAVLSLGLDVGRAITALQQGTPAPGTFSVRNRYPDVLTAHIQSNDLVADAALLGSTIPVADVLERVVVALFDRHAPLPRWWAYPDAAPGAYLATHDEEEMGENAAWMADAERSWGVAGSDFVIGGHHLTPGAVQRFGGAGRTLGLHYVTSLDAGAPRHELGIWRFRPAVRPQTLAEQAAVFEEHASRKPRSNRNHYLLWDETYAGLFRRMAAQGIRVDSTYGPDVGAKGYLFGTAQPFIALDRNGLPLPVREVPFQTAEDLGGADRAFIWKLLADSASRHHQPVHTLFHPNVFGWRPDATLYETWRDSFREAKRLGLHITSVEALVATQRARGASAMRSTWSDRVLAIEVDAAHDGATLAIPAVWDGVRGAVSVDGDPVTAQRVSYAGGDLLLVVTAPGARSVRVVYGETAR